MRFPDTDIRASVLGGLRAFFQPFSLIILVALVARVGLIQAFAIPSASMMPTLEPGDFVVVTPFDGILPLAQPRRGDVIVFRSPRDASEVLIKRVAAIPGDLVEIRSGEVWVNTERVAEAGRVGDRDARVLPPGSYFVLGDHREDSLDSRTWGVLDETLILGKAQVIFWSSPPSADQARDLLEGVRWNRLFRPVR